MVSGGLGGHINTMLHWGYNPVRNNKMTRMFYKPSALALSLALILSPMGEASRLAAQRVRLQTGSAKGVQRIQIINPGSIGTSGVSKKLGLNLTLKGTIPSAVRLSPKPNVTPEVVPSALESAAPQIVPTTLPTAQSKSLLTPKGLARTGKSGADFSGRAAKEKKEKEPVLLRLKRALSKRLSLKGLFDSSRAESARLETPASGMGILPRTPATTLPSGAPLDEEPVAPSLDEVAGISINNFSIPNSIKTGGIFERGPVILDADARNAADVERALRELVDDDAAHFGITTNNLKTVHAKRFKGRGQQADSIYVYFRQTKNGIPVHGTYLSFTVKVIRGTPILMASMARLYTEVDAVTTSRFSDTELVAMAKARMGVGPDEVDLEFVERKIIYQNGAWIAANLYTIQDMPFMIAVDVATGEAFAWDARLGAKNRARSPPGVEGTVAGRYQKTGPTRADSSLSKVPLPFLTVEIGGKKYRTDAEGRFSAPAQAAGSKITATLSGKYAVISDASGKTLKVSAVLAPGGENIAVFNPKGHDENMIAQVNAYVHVTKVHEWLKERGINNELLERALRVRTNIDDECNAYYTPGRPSLNFFRSSGNCSNSSYDSVVYHEYGHYVDDMIGGITNHGLSEGWGDIFSMFIIGSPIVGDGFMKQPRGGKDYIRHGENTHQFEKYDEAHAQGQVWMGFAWKLRTAMIAALGAAAGAAMAESLIVPTLFAKAADIPTAIAQVLLNDMDKKGNLPHEAEIRAAAKAHGVDLPKAPLLGPMNSLLVGFFPQAGKIVVGEPRVEPAGSGIGPAAGLNDLPKGSVKAKVPISLGYVVRQALLSQIESFCDFHGLKYGIERVKNGMMSSDYRLTLEGDGTAVKSLLAQLQLIGR